MAKMTTNENQISSPTWTGDFLSRDHLVPGGANIDPTLFNAIDAVIVTADGIAAADAVSIDVLPLSGPIPVGTVLNFGTKKFAEVTTAAVAGAIAIAVEALPTALADADVATYKGVGTKVVASGFAIGRTFAERSAGTDFGPAADADDEVYLVAFENPDADRLPMVELYRHNSVVKENNLPGFTDLSAAVLAKIRANYSTTVGVA